MEDLLNIFFVAALAVALAVLDDLSHDYMVSLVVIVIVFKRLFLFVLQSCKIVVFFFFCFSLSFSLAGHLLTTRGLLNNTVRKRY